jgi:hypothetical protein
MSPASRVMKLFSAFIGTSILSVLSPSQAKPLFDVIAFSVLVIAYLIHTNLSRSGVAVRCSKAFFLLLGVIIASYLLQYMSETLGGTIEIASSFFGFENDDPRRFVDCPSRRNLHFCWIDGGSQNSRRPLFSSPWSMRVAVVLC